MCMVCGSSILVVHSEPRELGRDAEGARRKSLVCHISAERDGDRRRRHWMCGGVSGARILQRRRQLPLRRRTLRTLQRSTYQLSSPTKLPLYQGLMILLLILSLRKRSSRWLSGKGNGLAPNEPGFNSRWYPHESLVVSGKVSGRNCSPVPVNVLLTLLARHPLNKEINNMKLRRKTELTYR